MAQTEMTRPDIQGEKSPRITRMERYIRRTRLDETPQLFHVMRGSMTRVGNRQHTMNDYGQYESHYRTRRSMKLGNIRPVTGNTAVAIMDDAEEYRSRCMCS
jgi:Sugar transferases involved in lipopolysaccharide synthesis